MRRRMRKVSTHLGLAVVLIFVFTTLASAEITEVWIGVDGTMTAHAAAEAQKALSRVEGVDNVEVRAEPAQAIITLKTGALLEPGKLRNAIVNAGLVPTWIQFEAVGLLTARDGTPAFKVQGTGQVIPLETGGKLKELAMAARRECELLTVVGLIPKGEETARIEHFEVWGFSGPRS